jgi:hypothetical protein
MISVLIGDKWLKWTHVAKLAKVSLNLIVTDFWSQSSDEDFSSASLRFLRINLLVVDDVITSCDDLVNGVSDLVDDEGESTWTTSGGVRLHVDALDLSVLSKVIAELLCKETRALINQTANIAFVYIYFLSSPSSIRQRTIFCKFT